MSGSPHANPTGFAPRGSALTYNRAVIGQSLARYMIESKLGEGGMGVVYKGGTPQLGRAVAIKVLPRNSLRIPSRKRRFAQEAKAASALNHPHIVTIFDIGSDAATTSS